MSLIDDSDQLPEIDPSKNYLEELVGEGKKFQTAADLARGKAEADAYIEIMKARQDELRADYLRLREEQTTGAKLQELIDRMSNSQQNNTTNTQKVEEREPPEYDLTKIESLVSSKLVEHETKKKQDENYNMVKAKLKEKYGSNYTSLLKEQIDTLGLTVEFVDDLARKHPNVLYKTLGLDAEPQRDTFQTPPRNVQRNDSFAPKTQKRTWSYYQNLKKTDPTLYHDRKTTIQMHRDAQELGEAFKDGDFARYGD